MLISLPIIVETFVRFTIKKKSNDRGLPTVRCGWLTLYRYPKIHGTVVKSVGQLAIRFLKIHRIFSGA